LKVLNEVTCINIDQVCGLLQADLGYSPVTAHMQNLSLCRLFVTAFPTTIALTAVAMSTACGHAGDSATVSANAPPTAAVVQVRRAPLSNNLTIAGEFLPYQEVELHAKVTGYIRHINVDIGDHVRAGHVLAVLEVPELVAQDLAASAGVRHSEEEMAREQNNISRSEADHEALHAAAKRLKQASEARSGLIAEQELDDATAKDRSAEAQVEAAKSALSAARQQLQISQADQQRYAAMSSYSRIR
jgi:multidrug efflux pump subunit AcrA (membrane-fusion protein)